LIQYYHPKIKIYCEKIKHLPLVKKKKEMPGAARAGIAILVLGAFLLGIGYYQDRGALSLYGLIMSICGFSLYMISSIYISRKSNQEKGSYSK
jgi:Zn-dependent protease with chaperone function